MKMDRKKFIKSASLLIGGAMIPGKELFAKTFKLTSAGFRELRNGTGYYTERGGTIGWFISKDGTVVIDSQFPDTAANFIAGFKEMSNQRIDILFNTHHHRDHTSGNATFKNKAGKIIAHENCVKLQRKMSNDLEAEVLADRTFKNTWTEKIGTEIITAQYFGIAHTSGDAVIHFENANVVHVGDLVFNRTYPYIDPVGEGLTTDWIKVLGSIYEQYDSDTIFIFGHAKNDDMVTGKKKDLLVMRDYLSALVELITKQLAEEKNIEEIMQSPKLKEFEDFSERWENAYRMNLDHVTRELIRK